MTAKRSRFCWRYSVATGLNWLCLFALTLFLPRMLCAITWVCTSALCEWRTSKVLSGPWMKWNTKRGDHQRWPGRHLSTPFKETKCILCCFKFLMNSKRWNCAYNKSEWGLVRSSSKMTRNVIKARKTNHRFLWATNQHFVFQEFLPRPSDLSQNISLYLTAQSHTSFEITCVTSD